MSDLVGYIAAALSVMAFMPQAWKIIKTRDTKDLSTPMWILEILAFALWVGYGIAKSALPIVIPNVICFALSLFILVMKLLPEHKKHAVADKLDPSVSTGS
jgi:MtN3 and saliva related transmembrane protein